MAETMKLSVDTGAVTIEVEDAKGNTIGSFDFVPTDSDILKRFDSVVEAFNNFHINEDDKSAESINRISDSIREQFDFLLGGPVSEGIFSKCGPLTVLKSGEFYFETVLEGIGNLIEKTTQQRVNKKLAKARAAAAKYKNE